VPKWVLLTFAGVWGAAYEGWTGQAGVATGQWDADFRDSAPVLHICQARG